MDNSLIDKLDKDISIFWCPGCNEYHHVNKSWTISWNGNNPTIRPSVLTRGIGKCHLFITAGKIQYLNDCTHKLKGQTIDMEKLP